MNTQETVACVKCGAAFSYYRKRKPRKFCSARCRKGTARLAQRNICEATECLECRSEFVSSNKRKFCSNECCAISNRNRQLLQRKSEHALRKSITVDITLKCRHCRIEFYCPPHRNIKPNFCSVNCRQLYKYYDRARRGVICRICSNSYSTKGTSNVCSRCCEKRAEAKFIPWTVRKRILRLVGMKELYTSVTNIPKEVVLSYTAIWKVTRELKRQGLTRGLRGENVYTASGGKKHAPIVRQCRICSKSYSGRRLTCSDDCHTKSEALRESKYVYVYKPNFKQQTEKLCKECGVKFMGTEMRKYCGKVCGRKCNRRNNRISAKERLANSYVAERIRRDRPQWRGLAIPPQMIAAKRKVLMQRRQLN